MSIHKHTARISALLALIGSAVSVHMAHAQTAAAAGSIFGFNLFDLIAESFANIINTIQMMAGFILSIAGSLLNYSIRLTLHIHDFVNATSAIYTTWKALRDISGMFLIFFLLYASIRLILGRDAHFGTLIKNIVMAGIVINFSFFFTGLGIDASNLVSVQLYNAIAPANALNAGNLSPNGVTEQLSDGGLADIFMSSLKIPSLFTIPGGLSGTGQAANAGGSIGAPFKIIIVGIISIVIMLTAALSFAAAALAFVVRFVVLLFLLAFSPIMFISAIAPEVATYSKELVGHYKNMLVFMPVYLLLMYFALNVLVTSPLLGGTNTAAVTATGGGAQTSSSLVATAYAAATGVSADQTFFGSLLVLGVNAVLVIVFLNMPLLVAMKIGGKAVSFIDTKKLGASALWRKVGANTIGRAAYGANENRYVKRLAAFNPLIGGAITGGLSTLSNTGFGDKKAGYKTTMDARKKAQEKLYKHLGDLDESRYDNKKKDSAGKTELDRAKAFRDGSKAMYRNSVVAPGFLGVMLDRSGRQTAAKLNKEAKKDADKAAAKSARENMAEMTEKQRAINDKVAYFEAGGEKNQKEMAALAEKIKSSEKLNNARKTMGLESSTAAEEKSLNDLQNMNSSVDQTIKDLKLEHARLELEKKKMREAIDKGEEIKEEERADKVTKKLEEIEGKIGGGDSGGGGGGKKEGGGEDKGGH